MNLPIHNPQKVLHISDALAKKTCKISGNYIATIKEDGWYCYADFHPDFGWSRIYSSANREIPAFDNLRERLSADFRPAVSIRMIWEATIPNTPFHIANGIFNRKYEQAEGVVLVAHDFFVIDYAAGMFRNPAALIRWNDLQTMKLPDCMRIATLLGISGSKSDWESWFESAVSNGEEGIVLKQCNSFYQPGKRNESLLKWKCEVEADLLCISVSVSVGKKGELATNLRLQSKSGTVIDVVVPKDGDAFKFRQQKESIVGKVCKIRAMKKLESGMYREPRFVCIREDKLPTDID